MKSIQQSLNELLQKPPAKARDTRKQNNVETERSELLALPFRTVRHYGFNYPLTYKQAILSHPACTLTSVELQRQKVIAFIKRLNAESVVRTTTSSARLPQLSARTISCSAGSMSKEEENISVASSNNSSESVLFKSPGGSGGNTSASSYISVKEIHLINHNSQGNSRSRTAANRNRSRQHMTGATASASASASASATILPRIHFMRSIRKVSSTTSSSGVRGDFDIDSSVLSTTSVASISQLSGERVDDYQDEEGEEYEDDIVIHTDSAVDTEVETPALSSTITSAARVDKSHCNSRKHYQTREEEKSLILGSKGRNSHHSFSMEMEEKEEEHDPHKPESEQNHQSPLKESDNATFLCQRSLQITGEEDKDNGVDYKHVSLKVNSLKRRASSSSSSLGIHEEDSLLDDEHHHRSPITALANDSSQASSSPSTTTAVMELHINVTIRNTECARSLQSQEQKFKSKLERIIDQEMNLITSQLMMEESGQIDTIPAEECPLTGREVGETTSSMEGHGEEAAEVIGDEHVHQQPIYVNSNIVRTSEMVYQNEVKYEREKRVVPASPATPPPSSCSAHSGSGNVFSSLCDCKTGHVNSLQRQGQINVKDIKTSPRSPISSSVEACNSSKVLLAEEEELSPHPSSYRRILVLVERELETLLNAIISNMCHCQTKIAEISDELKTSTLHVGELRRSNGGAVLQQSQ